MFRVFAVSISVVCLCGLAAAQGVWVNKSGAIKTIDSRALVVRAGGLCLATRDCVYTARNADGEWEPIFSLPSNGDEITALAARGDVIIVGTRKGVYRTTDNGVQWQQTLHSIFNGKCSVNCMSLAGTGDVIWTGTERGVFRSADGGIRWQDVSGNLKNKSVRKIAAGDGAVYACSEGGVYKKTDNGWDRVIVRTSGGAGDGEEPAGAESVSSDDEAVAARGPRCFALQRSRVYAGIDKRILYSDDAGASWAVCSGQGLSGTVTAILASGAGEKLFAATDKGVFEMDGTAGCWQELYKGAESQLTARDLVFEGQDEKFLWAVTDGGVYRFESGRYMVEKFQDVDMSMKRFALISTNEPTYRDLRQAAIKYADVSPEKVSNWHRESRMRALLPKVSVGFDKNSSTTAEIYTSATRDYIVAGPDDISNGIDVAVSWELGDLIWSANQTSIDVRSRLTTELRNDILEDLRRAYFERRRLQYELIAMPPRDPNIRIEKEMRLQELTQSIDDLTGNYLSEHSKPL